MKATVAVTRRKALGMLGSLPLLGTMQFPATAQRYPDRLLRLTVPFPAGGGGDILARTITAKMETLLGFPFVIENRAGAGGNIGSAAAARTEPDGYNLIYGTNGTLAINHTLYRSTGFDPFRDFDPVTRLTEIALVVTVSTALPISSLAELINYAKANPGKLNAATAGVGTSSHLAAEMFKQKFGIDWLAIHYRGGAQAMTDMLSGKINVMIEVTPNALPQIHAKAIKGLAVTTSQRWPGLDLPTMAELGYADFSLTAWDALLMPKGSPPKAIATINEAARAALADSQLQKTLLDRGSKPAAGSPEDLKTFMVSEYKRWGDIVRSAGATAE